MEDQEWSKLYGEVVWAKFQKFPWWPSYIYDPEKLPTTSGRNVIAQAQKMVGKQYVIYFYADGNFGFVTPKSVRPYNDETCAQFSGQKVGKKYEDSFEKAIALGKEEVLRPVAERVSWHYVAAKEERNAALDKKRGRGRPKKEKDESGLYFDEAGASGREGGDNEDVGEEGGEEDEETESESERPESESEFEQEEEDELMVVAPSRKRTGGSMAGSSKKRVRPSEYTNTAQTTAADQEEEEEVVVKGRSSADKSGTRGRATAITPSKGAAFAEESLVDRLTRLGGILKLCCAEGAAADTERAVKVLDKLTQITVTGADLVHSGVGKVVADLRKHKDQRVQERASALRNQWKAIVLQEQEGKGAPALTHVQAAVAGSGSGGAASSASASALASGPLITASTSVQKPAVAPRSPVAVAPSSAAAGSAGSGAMNIARSRAVRLLREAAESSRAAAASTASAASVNIEGLASSGTSGELAFAIEKALQATFGAGHPRYFECVTRLAHEIRNGLDAREALTRVADRKAGGCMDFLSGSIVSGGSAVLSASL